MRFRLPPSELGRSFGPDGCGHHQPDHAPVRPLALQPRQVAAVIVFPREGAAGVVPLQYHPLPAQGRERIGLAVGGLVGEWRCGGANHKRGRHLGGLNQCDGETRNSQQIAQVLLHRRRLLRARRKEGDAVEQPPPQTTGLAPGAANPGLQGATVRLTKTSADHARVCAWLTSSKPACSTSRRMARSG